MKLSSIIVVATLLFSGCVVGSRSELDTAKDQAEEDLHCDDMSATVFEPGYVSVYGCSTRATYECTHGKNTGWSCRRMY